jgi:hypothetical protein
VNRRFGRSPEALMQYLCLVYHEAALTTLPKPAYDALVCEVLAYREELRASGRDLLSVSLFSVQSATTIRIRNGQLTVGATPFTSAKGQLGGFFLISAADLNDAIRVAARLPTARFGCVEVWPVQESDLQPGHWSDAAPGAETVE